MNARGIRCVIAAVILTSAAMTEDARGQSPDTVAIMRAFGRALVSNSHGNRIALVRNLAIRGNASGPLLPERRGEQTHWPFKHTSSFCANTGLTTKSNKSQSQIIRPK